MARVVIVHGWSDTSKSFEPLAGFLRAQEIAVTSIYLGDYISLDDKESNRVLPFVIAGTHPYARVPANWWMRTAATALCAYPRLI